MKEFLRRFSRASYLASNSPSKANQASKWIIRIGALVVATFSFVTGVAPDEIAGPLKSFFWSHITDIAYVAGFYPLVLVSLRVYATGSRWSETRRRDVVEAWPRLAETVLPSTRRFRETIDADGLDTIGGAIEVFAHPNNDGGIDDNGWALRDVHIAGEKQPFVAPKELNPNILVPGENGRKYSLVGFTTPFKDDSENLRLMVRRTDWQAVRRAVSVIETDEQMRHRYSDIDPAKHRIPHSLCLHVVCLTSESEFIALKRSATAAYWPGAMSISFEEQFAESDFHEGGNSRMEAWLYRALCEELFPLVGLHSRNAAAAAAVVSEFIVSTRIWSCLFEETTGNFSLFGVVRLNVSAAQLPAIFETMKREHKTSRDDEGRLYFFSNAQIDDLLLSGHATATPLLRPDLGPESVRTLHPTSLYRAARVASCLR